MTYVITPTVCHIHCRSDAIRGLFNDDLSTETVLGWVVNFHSCLRGHGFESVAACRPFRCFLQSIQDTVELFRKTGSPLTTHRLQTIVRNWPTIW